MGFFSGRAVLLNDLNHERRQRAYWQNRAESLEQKMEAERSRNAHAERYLLNLLLIKQVKASPIPDADPHTDTAESPQPDETLAALEEFRNGEFAEWARAAGVSEAEAFRQFEQMRPLYAQQLS